MPKTSYLFYQYKATIVIKDIDIYKCTYKSNGLYSSPEVEKYSKSLTSLQVILFLGFQSIIPPQVGEPKALKTLQMSQPTRGLKNE